MKSQSESDRYVICPACEGLNARLENVCGQCGTAIAAPAPIDSIRQPKTTLLEQSTQPRPRPLLLIGFWIIFVPEFLASIYAALFWARHHYGMAEFIMLWGSIGFGCLYFVILYRATRKYLVTRATPPDLDK